jgi:preprotein translocase subunit Sec61beta
MRAQAIPLGGGLMQYYSEYKSKRIISPKTVIILAIILIAIELLARL